MKEVSLWYVKKERRNKMRNLKVRKRFFRARDKLRKINIERYRLTIKRSLKNISAQIIDDKKNLTLISASSLEKKLSNNEKKKKSDVSTFIGEILAKRALEKKINKIYFDRGRYKYHGRVKNLVESLRKNGLNI